MTTMTLRNFAMAAAVLLAGMFAADEVRAVTSSEFGNDISGCGTAFRISKTDATCLTASWNNANYEVENECASYGEMGVRIDKISVEDTLLFLDSSRASFSYSGIGHVRKITCCLDRSEICYKNQVEADSSGRIRSITIDGANVSGTYIPVSTHQERWDYCKDNSDDIYCTNDPEGDANTDPDAPAPQCGTDTTAACNCGDHFCGVGDCNWHWGESQAGDTCTDDEYVDFTMSISATDGSSQTCTMSTRCRTGEIEGSSWVWTDSQTVSDEVWNMDDYRNCGGTPTKVDSCPDDNQIDD